jgi:hypothetical protein
VKTQARLLKVAELDELPPGRGKTIAAGGREVTVVNREGRYLAVGRTHAYPAPAGPAETDGDHRGRAFSIGIGESDRVELVGDRTYVVRVDETGVWVLLD